MANHTYHDALDLKRIVVVHEDRLHGLVGGMEFDDSILALIGLDGRVPTHQGYHCMSVPCRGLFLHDHHIAWQNSFISHGLAFHAQGKGVATLHMFLGTSTRSV